MDSCPKEMEVYDKAHKKRVIEQDKLQHMWWGNYGISALIVAIDHCINAKKAKSEYVKEAITSKGLFDSELTESEIYEKDLRKALMAEEQWIISGKRKGLPETVI